MSTFFSNLAVFGQYIFTHIFFYITIFIIQSYIIFIYLLNYIFVVTQSIELFCVLKIFYFIHSFYGITAIIDDYVFNRFIRYLVQVTLFLIAVKLFFILLV